MAKYLLYVIVISFFGGFNFLGHGTFWDFTENTVIKAVFQFTGRKILGSLEDSRL